MAVHTYTIFANRTGAFLGDFSGSDHIDAMRDMAYRSGHDSLGLMLESLGMSLDSIEWLMVDDSEEEGGRREWLLYRSSTDMEDDDDGSNAALVIYYKRRIM